MACRAHLSGTCLALVTFLPTLLTKLTGTNCLEMSAGSAGLATHWWYGGIEQVHMTFRGCCLAETEQVARMPELRPGGGIPFFGLQTFSFLRISRVSSISLTQIPIY